MATNPNKDLVLSDPIGSVKKVSDISLIGGSVVFFAVCYAVYKMNVGAADDRWSVNTWLLLSGVIAATILAAMSAALKAYDARLRVRLTLRLLELKGTTDAEAAKDLPIISHAIDMTKIPLVYAMRPGQLQDGS